MDETNKLSKKEITHILAFVSGVLSIVFTPIWYVGVIHGVIAVIYGVRSGLRKKYKLGKAGFILGIIGLSLSGIVLIVKLIQLFLYLDYYY